VRTVGLAGLGALGVSFGTTLAFDSPAAKDAGPFNWGSTVWHELAHTFTLGSTDHRIPRWLSEGLSVYEEHHAKPGWGFNVSPDFLMAFKTDSLVPVSRMNDGFMHPAFPGQVQLSYYQASLVCDLIARDYGEGALGKMLQAYKDGMTTEQVFQRVLNIDIKAFDKKFNDYIRTRFATALASLGNGPPKDISGQTPVQAVQALASTKPNDFGTQLFAGEAMLEHNEPDRAIPYLEKAIRNRADYVPARVVLARALMNLNQWPQAIAALNETVALDPKHPQPHLLLSQIFFRMGDEAKAKAEKDISLRLRRENPTILEAAQGRPFPDGPGR